jgi:hypothetical protein
VLFSRRLIVELGENRAHLFASLSGYVAEERNVMTAAYLLGFESLEQFWRIN